jgi:O-antigen/teichoic acid export membrane protein
MYMITAGMPFFGWIIFQRLYGMTDPIVLRYVSGPAAAGFFSVSFRLILTLLAFPQALIIAVQPTLSRLFKENDVEFRTVGRRLLSLALMCSIPISSILTLMPNRVMALLPYGAKFAKSILVLQIGGFGVAIYYAAMVMGTTIITRDGQRFLMRNSIMAVLFGVPLRIALSYFGIHAWHNAAAGAMFSDVLLEIFLVCCYLYVLPRDMYDLGTVKTLFKCIVASLPMAACLLLAKPMHIGIWIVVPCTLVYAAGCWALGCIRPKDIAAIRGALRRKVAR